jgi:hypothetical protein
MDSSKAQWMSNGLLVMNSVVTSQSSVAPCSTSMPSGNQTKLPGPNVPACAAPTRSTKSPVQTPRTRTRNARTPTPGHRTSTPDSGQRIVDMTCADTGRSPGHRTRGRDRVLGQGDLDTAGTGQTSRTTTTRPPAGTPNHGPVDGTCGARQRRRLGDDAVMERLGMRYVGEFTGRGLVEGRDGVYDGAPFALSTIGRVDVGGS